MGNRTLSVPSIVVNNENIAIVPGTFMYSGGEGEIVVRAASAGGANTTSVHSENAETQIGKCKFEIFLTPDVDAKIAQWKENVGANSVQAVQRAGAESITLSFDHMSLVNEVERQASADGTVALEFEGDRMSNQ